MARGRKKIAGTLEEQLEAVNAELLGHEEAVKKLRQKRKEIEGKTSEEKKEALYQAVIDSGKTIEEILADLSDKNTEEYNG